MKDMRLGLSSYCFWHFSEKKTPIEYVIQKAREMGVDGIEILHVQMESESNDYLQKLKRMAYLHGLDIYCLSIHQDFVSPEGEVRKRNVEHTKKCIDTAYRLGAPSIRLNSGRWRTVKSFNELMQKRGVEPPIEGYTEDDAFGWIIECIQKCLPKAEEYGVILGLENHWGLTSTPEGVNRIIEAVNSDWLKVVMDTGNFLDNTYESLLKIAPHTVMVHAKTYFGGGEWYTLDIDYKRVMQILDSVNFSGYISIEFEGKEDPLSGVVKSIELIRNAVLEGE